jgi:flagellar basal-body rod protein FlgB
MHPSGVRCVIRGEPVSYPSVGNDATINVLKYAIDGISLAQKQTGANVTNDQTPDYIAEEVTFDQSLQHAIMAPGGGTAQASTYVSNNPPGTDGNNVNLTDELMTADRHTLQYEAVVDALNFKFRLLKGAMGGGFS